MYNFQKADYVVKTAHHAYPAVQAVLPTAVHYKPVSTRQTEKNYYLNKTRFIQITIF